MVARFYLNGSFDPDSGVVVEVWSDVRKYASDSVSRDGLDLRTILTANDFMETEAVLNKMVVHGKTFGALYKQAEKLLSIIRA